MLGIHREGRLIILVSLIILSSIFWLNVTLIDSLPILQFVIASLIVILFGFILNFFRNPKRNPVPDDNLVLSPADGKIVVIEEAEEDEYFKDKRIQVSIFMGPTNVHVNRVPVTGEVKYIKYHPGKFLVAWHPKSSKANERNSVVIANHRVTLLFRQIAGVVARRIRCYLKEGEKVIQGNEMGFIKFGSRVDIFFPVGVKLEVKLHQTVKGGEAIIARLA